MLMVLGSIAYYPWRHYGSWPAYAILDGGIILIPWHVILIIAGRPRLGYALYTFANLLVYYILAVPCLVMVTGDFL
jgi:hypothetical protein